MSRARFEPFSPDVWQDPYPYYRQLRQEEPVCYFENEQLWAVSRWSPAVDALRRPDAFSSVGKTSFEDTLLGADPPAHTRVRRLLSAAFSTEAMTAFEPRIRSHVDRLFDELVPGGACEFMTAFAKPFPLLVLGEMLGIDAEEFGHLADWASDAAAGDVVRSDSELTQVQARRDASEAFFDEYIERCCHRSPRGILDPLLQSRSKDDRLTPAAGRDLAKLLVIAGTETTTNLLGNGMLALLRAPDQWTLISQDALLIPSLVEETLRYDSPAQNVKRRASRDVELAGVLIPRDALVLVLLGSANRDEVHFENPDQFSIRRQPNDHIAFGAGPHFCIGARLARVEARVAFEVIVERFGVLRATTSLEDVGLVDSTRIRGPKRLDLAFDPR